VLAGFKANSWILIGKRPRVEGPLRALNRFRLMTALLQNEIKLSQAAVVRIAHAQDQPAVKQTIPAIQRLARKVQLGRKYAAAGLLDLEMIVAGSAGICSWHNCGEPPATNFIRVLIAP
jgi:hypothetical protein